MKMSAPDLGGIQGWWKYLTNVGTLSPVSPGQRSSGFPEGVLQLGGTLIIQGDDVLFQWNDVVPGDHPEMNVLQRVLEIAVNESKDAAIAEGRKRMNRK
jgi:hypothetical protein